MCVLKFAPGLMQFEFTALLLTTEKLEMLMKATVFLFLLSFSFSFISTFKTFVVLFVLLNDSSGGGKVGDVLMYDVPPPPPHIFTFGRSSLFDDDNCWKRARKRIWAFGNVCGLTLVSCCTLGDYYYDCFVFRLGFFSYVVFPFCFSSFLFLFFCFCPQSLRANERRHTKACREGLCFLFFVFSVGFVF